MMICRALLLLGLTVGSDFRPWPEKATPLGDFYDKCSSHPEAFGDWIPPHHLKQPTRKSTPGPIEVADGMDTTRCMAGVVLRSYQEPLLASGSIEETYRVIWYPPFSPPVAIRIQRGTDGAYVALIKRDHAAGEQLTGQYAVWQVHVAASDFEEVRASADRAGCWVAGHTCHAELSDLTYRSGCTDCAVVVGDGERWFLEGSRKGGHWAVQVSSPEGGPFMEVCAAIVKAARAEGALIGPTGRVREWKPNLVTDGGS
jgi:hypothetical protein